MKPLQPSVVCVAMKAIVPEVDQATERAKLDACREALPFPARHRPQYVSGLTDLVKAWRRRGILGLCTPQPDRESGRRDARGTEAPLVRSDNAPTLSLMGTVVEMSDVGSQRNPHRPARFEYLVDSLEILLTEPRLLPVTIGVTGDWGSGKSSLMQMACSRLTTGDNARKYIPVSFSPWRFEDYAHVKVALMAAVVDAIAEYVEAEDGRSRRPATH